MENRQIWKGTKFWTDEIRKAGIMENLLPFNDVLTGNEPPAGYGEPMVKDVILDGVVWDIYHTDYNKATSGNRIFIYKKT